MSRKDKIGKLSKKTASRSSILEAVNFKEAEAKAKGETSVLTVGDMLGIAQNNPNIRGVAMGFVGQYGFTQDKDGLRTVALLAMNLKSLRIEINEDSGRVTLEKCKRVILTDSSKIRISKQIFGLYALLVLAEHDKIVTSKYNYNSEFKCHATYTFISADFASKHVAVAASSDDKNSKKKAASSGKALKKASKKVALDRNTSASTSITGSDQIQELNQEIESGNKTSIFNKIEAKFQTMAASQGKVVKMLFFGTQKPYSVTCFSTTQSAKGKLQCEHAQARFFYSTAKKSGTHYLYHYEGTEPKEGWVKGGTKDLEAYAVLTEPQELLDAQDTLAFLKPLG
jgi:hypothetical protein